MKTTKLVLSFHPFALYLSAFFCCLSANAQLHVDLEVANQTNQVFGGLDKSKIPHDMLLDYGYDFVDVPNYDGVLRDNNYLVPSVYRTLYNSVVSMRTTLLVPELVDPIALEQSWKSKTKFHAGKLGKGVWATPVTLNGLYYHYSRIRKDALDQDLIEVVDGKAYEDAYKDNVWQNPYETKEVFAMALPNTEMTNSSVSLLLPDTEWHTNQPGLIGSFAVDFGDGNGFQPLKMGVPLGHDFKEDGDYVWTFRLKLTNGTFKYCRTPVKITGKAAQQTLTARNPDCDKKPWEEIITASKAYQGVKGVAKLQIAAANECKTISKPLIVVEGFDTGLMGNEPKWGDTHLQTFLGDVIDSENNSLQNLITADTEESFDIIYVNWADGTDWLQRNAYALEAVIQWVNENKQDPTVPNVVLGQSMGGVIARYALRDMENNNLDHDTSLYISHDAPHQGANVPPGSLYMVRHVLNEVITTPIGDMGVAVASGELPVNEARELIDRPAVRQLLVNWIDSSYELNNTEHKAWQDELKLMGYPQQTRNIALSNGSHCAQPYAVEPGQTLFRLNGEGATSMFTDLVTFILPSGWVVGAALGDIPTVLLGFLPGSTKLKIDFHTWAIPGGQDNWVYKGLIQYEKKFLWVAPITRSITDRAFDWQGDDLVLSDKPGGAMPFIHTIDEIDEYEEGFLAGYSLNLEMVDSPINFISVTSALDVGGNNIQLTEEEYFRVYTTENPPPPQLSIPFDNYTTTYDISWGNAQHISFNRSNGDWLANELKEEAESFDCSYLCKEFTIEGSPELCEEEIYFVNVGDNVQVQWSSSDPEVASPTNPNSSATAFTTAPNTYSEQVTITATLTSEGCGDDAVILQKVVYTGKPGLPSDLWGPEIVLTGALVKYYGGPAEGADHYEWWLPHPFDVVDQFDYFGDNWQIRTTNTYYDVANVFTGFAKNNGYVQLMGVNECGRGPARKMYVTHAEDGEIGEGGIPMEQNPGYQSNNTSDESDDGVVIYPNTATDEVNITLKSSDMADGIMPSTILGVAVYQQLEQVPIKRLSFPSSGIVSTILDVRDLRDGYYFVVIETDKGPVTKILLVK